MLVGIFSWPTREGLRRRDVIRATMPLGPRALVRFVMVAARDKTKARSSVIEDGPERGVWNYRLPYAARVHSKLIGKYVLANLFLRHAATLGHRFILRTDDDALFNAGAVAEQLARLPLAWTHVVYGVSRE